MASATKRSFASMNCLESPMRRGLGSSSPAATRSSPFGPSTTTPMLISFSGSPPRSCCSRGMPGLYGLEKRRELATYELLYVGMSKVEDAFDRLLHKPHDKRLRILANEQQKSPGARVTDETYLLFFTTDVLRIHTFALDTDFYAEFATPPDLHDPRIVADAEKAFVRFIDGRYNTVKYKQ